jgi:hypothetical protein
MNAREILDARTVENSYLLKSLCGVQNDMRWNSVLRDPSRRAGPEEHDVQDDRRLVVGFEGRDSVREFGRPHPNLPHEYVGKEQRPCGVQNDMDWISRFDGRDSVPDLGRPHPNLPHDYVGKEQRPCGVRNDMRWNSVLRDPSLRSG